MTTVSVGLGLGNTQGQASVLPRSARRSLDTQVKPIASFAGLQRFLPLVTMRGCRPKHASDSLNVLKPGRVDTARTKHQEDFKEGRKDRALPCHSGHLDVPELLKRLATKEASGFEPGCHTCRRES